MNNIQKLDQIHITDSTVLFTLSVNNCLYTYIADVEEDQKTFNSEQTYNKASLSVNNNVIHNMYKISECFLKNAQKNGNTNSTFNFPNIFQHKLSDDNCKFTTLNNTLYGIATQDNYGHYVLSNDIYGFISSDNDKIVPNDTKISTLLFNTDNFKDGNFNNTTNIENIKYAKIIEIPGNNFNDFDSGNFAASTYNAKNHYSSTYNMEHTDKIKLKNTRNYIGIGSTSNCVYLKYYDNIDYYDDKVLYNDNKLLKYQNLEVLGAISRNNISNAHKTNLFSLDINIKNISNNLSNVNNNALSILQLQIKNAVKKYLEQFIPANTQIFNININI